MPSAATVSYTHLTGTRRTQNQAVGVFQQLSIHHDEVVGQSIDAVVQGFFAVLKDVYKRQHTS